jgi:hypothetical protein
LGTIVFFKLFSPDRVDTFYFNDIIMNRFSRFSRIFGSAPNSPNTRCHLCDLVGLTSLWHSHRRVHNAGSTFTFFKPANCTRVACHVCTTRYLRNAMQRRLSISALGSVYDVAQTNLWRSLWTKFTSMVQYETPCRRDWLFDREFSVPAGRRTSGRSPEKRAHQRIVILRPGSHTDTGYETCSLILFKCIYFKLALR